ncbi:hypothetical protein [Comamonas flocculans]|uniref:Uncharacterized protein n=1 Tax=Comamonas flocculans TaxID=2597701 RepID=A0A5B8RTP7_9BURK|nr:hypothetical protein [Comamonas flocculans]QEA12092.1 hypothetical protein FOZ74_03015 [Comamonas flocculans]
MLTNEEREALLSVARERLKNRHRDYRRFEHAVRHGVLGWLYAENHGVIVRAYERIASPDELEAMERGRMIHFIDSWAEKKSAAPAIAPLEKKPKETAAQMGARHWQACIDAGLVMPGDSYAQYPRGISEVARAEGIKRQTFAKRLDAYREQKFGQ